MVVEYIYDDLLKWNAVAKSRQQRVCWGSSTVEPLKSDFATNDWQGLPMNQTGQHLVRQ
jgi:hypothetical protein